MKKERKIIIFFTVIVLILIGILIYQNTKEKGERIDWATIVNVEFSGVEGDSYVSITYNDIDSLKENVRLVVKDWEDTKIEMTMKEEYDALKEKKAFVADAKALLNKNWCVIEGDSRTLKNNDKLVLRCGNKAFKELGYVYDETIEFTVEGLGKKEIVQEIPENNVNQGIEKKEEDKSDEYVVLGNDLFTTYENLEYIDANKGDYRCIVEVYTQTELQKAIETARSVDYIEFIQYGLQVWTRESNFTEWEEWKGITY